MVDKRGIHIEPDNAPALSNPLAEQVRDAARAASNIKAGPSVSGTDQFETAGQIERTLIKQKIQLS